jgi:3'(2'), 5'-bisphosphate nucleotidase
MSMGPEKLTKIGGSGKKTLMVLEGQSDIYVYIGNKTKKWDICPGDALIRCFGVSQCI